MGAHYLHYQETGWECRQKYLPWMQKRWIKTRLGERDMRIKDIIKFKDTETYRKLKKVGKRQQKIKDKEIKLGDRPERLMQHDAYKRKGRRIKQIKWG